ncbi:Scr1 family TA system antitoxin-like transcriptional regulator [Nocardia amamiensis]|uniref:Scr1 family TA system antitoxin-like transcriptional regulator n=1 Tax=Nocardia amamiensis TaxID=404578 RepID=UPI0034DD6ED5
MRSGASYPLDDLDTAVAARMARQDILRTRVAVLVHEAALYTTLGDDEVTAGQLRHLLDVAFDNPRLFFRCHPTMSRVRPPLR